LAKIQNKVNFIEKYNHATNSYMVPTDLDAEALSVGETNMPKAPAVSVVIPLYNKDPFIARALNSVLAQNFHDFEVIVVDDGSTDGSVAIVREFSDPRIRLIQQENGGVSAARNRGIKAARADLVAFLDADDEWLPGFLETILHLRKRFPEAGAYATAISTARDGVVKRTQYRSIPSPNWEGMVTDYFRTQILGDSVMSSSSIAIPRDILEEMNGFAVDAKWGEDLDLWGRIALRYPIGFSTSHCSTYHVTGEDIKKIYSRVTDTRENPFIKSANVALKEEYNRFIEEGYLMLYLDKLIVESARYNAIVGKNTESREILRKCRTKGLFFSKAFLSIWYIIPMCISTNRIRDIYLLLVLPYLQALELRIVSSIMERRRHLMMSHQSTDSTFP
jgi:glycosyltransferase involved in cell wall biosynthesis